MWADCGNMFIAKNTKKRLKTWETAPPSVQNAIWMYEIYFTLYGTIMESMVPFYLYGAMDILMIHLN